MDEHSGSFDSKSSNKKRRRGPTTGKGFKPKSGEVVQVTFDKLKNPQGDYKQKFITQIGINARNKVPITFTKWPKVPDGLKNLIWEDLKTLFNLDDDPDIKESILIDAGTRWKQFKSFLVREYIKRRPEDHESPCEVYDFITPQQWEEFKEQHQSEDWQEMSRKAVDSISHSKYPHHLGSTGYAGKRAEWANFDPLSSSSSCSELNSCANDRAFDWARARMKKTDSGSYIFPDEQTNEVFDTIVSKTTEVSLGTFVPERQYDVLSASLGKADHPGRVRGCGKRATLTNVFGKRKGNSEGSSGMVSQEVIRQLQAQMQSQIESAVEKKLAAILQQHGLSQIPGAHRTEMLVNPQVRSSCYSVYPNPFDGLQKPICCTLAVSVNGEPIQVAEGTVWPSETNIKVHHRDLLEGHVRVTVDRVLPDAGDHSLPVPFPHHNLVREAEGSFTQWPKDLVLLGEEGVQRKVEKTVEDPKKKKSFEVSSSCLRHMLVDSVTYERLSETCQSLHDLLRNLPVSEDIYPVQMNRNTFYTDEEEMNVFITDIVDLLSMEWLTQIILKIWAMYLHKLCEDHLVESIGFMCPERIAEGMCIKTENVNYMSHAMHEQQSCRFILAPYFQKRHWVLLVICTQQSTVYVLDPLEKPNKSLQLKRWLDMAFRLHYMRGGQRRESSMQWKYPMCPKQPGGSECGYYVMRYMLEFVRHYHANHSLDKVSFGEESYTQDQIDEVRNLWAEYFMYDM